MELEHRERVEKLAREKYRGQHVRIRAHEVVSIQPIRKGDGGEEQRGVETILPGEVVDVPIEHKDGYQSPVALALMEDEGKFERVSHKVDLTEPPGDDPYRTEDRITSEAAGEAQAKALGRDKPRPGSVRGISPETLAKMIADGVAQGVAQALVSVGMGKAAPKAKGKEQPAPETVDG